MAQDSILAGINIELAATERANQTLAKLDKVLRLVGAVRDVVRLLIADTYLQGRIDALTEFERKRDDAADTTLGDLGVDVGA